MKALLKPRRLLALLLAGLATAGYAADWQSLLGNSPFGQNAAAATPAAAPDDLEFRGVVQEEGQYLVNLYNPTTQKSQWVEVNGHAPGLEVKSYDAGADKVQITQAGRSLTLALKQTRVALVQLPNPTPAPAPADNPEEKSKEERRAELREAMRARSENGEAAAGFRNLPPEAQAMIQEFRRRRSESAAKSQQARTGNNAQSQPESAGRRPRP